MPAHRLSRAAKLAALVLSSVLLVLFITGTKVLSLRPSHTPTAIVLAGPNMANSTAAAVDLGWYAPAQTLINNLTNVASANTAGVYGFIYNSSYTPDAVYGQYNWCNMPHVRASEYIKPSDEYDLVYVELIHRHHKRTPYAANSFPVEPYTWDCNDQGLYYFAAPFSSTNNPATPNAGRNASAEAYWVGTSAVAGFTNPFELSATGFKGSCQFPQITASGLDDSWQHGADLYGAYGELLGFLPARDDTSWRDKVQYRVTNNVITSEVAGMVVNGMWATTESVPLLVQPSGVDSLEPDYTCTSASAQFGAIESRGSNAAWAAHLDAAAALYDTLDGISGVAPDDQGFHASFDHYYDNLSARQCHGKPLPCTLASNDTNACVTQADADAVYRFGHWEYSQIYRDAGAAALAASVGSMGVWLAELAAHLRAAVAEDGDSGLSTIWFHNIAHDGSISRLLGILQTDVMVWPGMGSEVVFELWKKNESGDTGVSARSQYFVRVLFGGRVLTSSNPSLGMLDMLPIETLLAYFDGLAGVNAGLIVDKCSAS